MERRQAMRLSSIWGRRLRPMGLAACVALVALAGAPANAVEAPPGTKNFTPPGYVPNYFSNESGSFRGAPAAGAAQPGAIPVVAMPAPHRKGVAVVHRRPRHRHQAVRHQAVRHHARRAATAHGRFRAAQARTQAHRRVLVVHRQIRHSHAARSPKPSRQKSAHAPVKHAKGKAVAAKTRHAPAEVRRVARAGG